MIAKTNHFYFNNAHVTVSFISLKICSHSNKFKQFNETLCTVCVCVRAYTIIFCGSPNQMVFQSKASRSFFAWMNSHLIGVPKIKKWKFSNHDPDRDRDTTALTIIHHLSRPIVIALFILVVHGFRNAVGFCWIKKKLKMKNKKQRSRQQQQPQPQQQPHEWIKKNVSTQISFICVTNFTCWQLCPSRGMQSNVIVVWKH